MVPLSVTEGGWGGGWGRLCIAPSCQLLPFQLKSDPSLPKTPNLEARLKLKFFSCLPWALKGARAAFPEAAEALQDGVPLLGCPGVAGAGSKLVPQPRMRAGGEAWFHFQLLVLFHLLVALALEIPRSTEGTPPPSRPKHTQLHTGLLVPAPVSGLRPPFVRVRQARSLAHQLGAAGSPKTSSEQLALCALQSAARPSRRKGALTTFTSALGKHTC